MNNGQATIHGSVLAAAAARPDAVALVHRVGGRPVAITYGALVAAVQVAAAKLVSLGLRKSDVVGILSPNRPEWIIADLAVLSVGGVVVPIYHTLPDDQIAHIVRDSGMRALLVGSAGLLARAEAARSEFGCLRHVISLDGWGAGSRDTVREPAPGGDVAASDAATIVYTSGTTGEPKGAVLTHGNIVSNVRALIDRYRITSDDSAVSYLPLAHMFERTCGHYVFLFAGGTVAYAESLSTVARDVAAFRPTVLIAVPRVLERAYETALAKVESGPWIGRGLVRRAVTVLNERANLRYQGKRVPLWLRARCRVYDALVASRFRRVGGGRLRLIVSGGAPLDRRIGKILRVLGFGVVEGYGLTETSPVVCCGDIEHHRLGTVGKPLDGVEVRIAGDGEILVRGPNVMRGYLNRPEETAAALGPDGWFHTGDLGTFDEDGNLAVTGRSKDIIVTSYGKNVAPGPVEERITGSRYVDQAVVLGDNRKCLVALIVPARAAIEQYARERGIGGVPYGALLEHEAVRELISGEVKRANSELAPYERVTEFALLAEPFSEEGGTLTPTLKLRRKRIAETCTDMIGALYEKLEKKHAH